MKELIIDCNGIANISFANGYGTVKLEDVDMSFLEELPSKVICQNHNNEQILDYIGYVEICDYLEGKYDIKIEERK
jgi:hypothetical protein